MFPDVGYPAPPCVIPCRFLVISEEASVRIAICTIFRDVFLAGLMDGVVHRLGFSAVLVLAHIRRQMRAGNLLK